MSASFKILYSVFRVAKPLSQLRGCFTFKALKRFRTGRSKFSFKSETTSDNKTLPAVLLDLFLHTEVFSELL